MGEYPVDTLPPDHLHRTFIDVREDAVYMSYLAYSLLMHNLYLYPFFEDGKLIIRKGSVWRPSTKNIFIDFESYPIEGKGKDEWPMTKLWSKEKNPKMYNRIAGSLPLGLTFGAIINNKFVAEVQNV